MSCVCVHIKDSVPVYIMDCDNFCRMCLEYEIKHNPYKMISSSCYYEIMIYVLNKYLHCVFNNLDNIIECICMYL